MRVELFKSSNIEELESNLNDLFEELQDEQIIEIKFSTTEGDYGVNFFAMVLYKD